MNYRPEIDGLRALAVIPVIIFHSGCWFFSGGFVGVDVFFVISGFLITSIIMKEAEAGPFSLKNFYLRRIRRILPALFLIFFFCILFAWLWIEPYQMKEFCHSLIASVLFVPNFYFWSTSSYFETASELKILLHTWSLGVEEQFYLFFPLLLAILTRRSTKFRLVSLVTLGLISFALSELTWRIWDNETGFYLTHSRIWELTLGAIVAMYAKLQDGKRVPAYAREAASLIGLGAIIYPTLSFTANDPYPSYLTLVPTVGTAMVLFFATANTFTARLLSIKPLVAIGLISYSLYLWHHPVFAFTRIYMPEKPGSPEMMWALALTIALAAMSYYLVETPLRKRDLVSDKKIVRAAIACSVFFFTFGIGGHVSDGYEFRFSEKISDWKKYSNNRENGRYIHKRFEALTTDFPDQASKKMLIVGDSFAKDFLNAIAESGLFTGYEIRTAYVPYRCQIYFGTEDISRFVGDDASYCDSSKQVGHFLDRIRAADVIILAANWEKWSAQRVTETVRNLKDTGAKRTLVIGRKDFGKVNLNHLIRFSVKELAGLRNKVDSDQVPINSQMKNILPPEEFLDLHEIVCGSSDTCPLFSDEGKLISHDGEHLTRDGAMYLGKLLRS